MVATRGITVACRVVAARRSRGTWLGCQGIYYYRQYQGGSPVVSFTEFGGGVETGGVGAADVSAVEFSVGSTRPWRAQSVQLVG